MFSSPIDLFIFQMPAKGQSTVIVGVDIGSWTFKVSVFKNKSFEILTNEANFRQTPSLISFVESQRHIGEQAQNRIKSNFMNTIRSPLRLIGIEKSYDVVEDQLKYTTAKYDLGDELHFLVQVDKGRNKRIHPEHLLVSLLSKVYKITQSHGLSPSSYVLAVPSYMSHYERKIVKRCGEIVLHSQEISLIDDWLSLASQYAYNKVVQLKISEPRIAVLLDIGYAKCSFFVIEFNKKEFRLLDSQHLRYVGSKNMDHLLAEFYDQKLKHLRNSQESIFSSHKSLVKVIDHIEKQRKILSANEDSHLSIESLVEDIDLSHNMKRDQFEKIVGLVLSQIREGIKKIRERMPATIKPYSIELLGGGSRIPAIKNIVQEVFKMQPSRSLNQSEAMARGASVFGAVSNKLWPLYYDLKDMNLVDICVCWNATGLNNNFFGQNEKQYDQKQVIFKANGAVPDQNVLSFNDIGPVQLYIYYGHTVSTRSIGYVRFNTPNRIKFILDKNKIVSVKLQSGEFSVCKLQDKKEAKWTDLHEWETESQINEQRIKRIHEMKNLYEAKFYDLRNKIQQLRQYMTREEIQSISNQLSNIEAFIDEENTRHLNSDADLELYESKLRQIDEYSQPLVVLQQRKGARGKLLQKYERLRQEFEKINPSYLNEVQCRKYKLLLQWTIDSYQKMIQSKWQGYYFTDVSLQFAIEQLQRILRM